MKLSTKTIMSFTIILFTACGPSAEDKAAQEKAKQDSIIAATELATRKKIEDEKRVADSLAAVETAMGYVYQANSDSLAAVAEFKQQMEVSLPVWKRTINQLKIELELSNERLKEIDRNREHISFDEKENLKRKEMQSNSDLKIIISLLEEVVSKIESGAITQNEFQRLEEKIGKYKELMSEN